MGMRGAQHDGVQATRRRVVGDVAAGAAQERVVLLAPDRLADAELGKGVHARAPLLKPIIVNSDADGKFPNYSGSKPLTFITSTATGDTRNPISSFAGP
jgi:hypothetical protein